jgi:hypothetical protein
MAESRAGGGPGGGFLAGVSFQRPVEAQMSDVMKQAVEAAGQQGGSLGSAAKLGTSITDMQEHVNGLQKNIDTLKQIQTSLGG